MIRGILFVEFFPKEKRSTPSSGDQTEQNSEMIIAKWRIVADYIPAAEDRPNADTLEEMIFRFQLNPGMSNLNFRLFPHKYYISLIQEEKYCIVYILDISESLEIVRINPDTIQVMLLEVAPDSRKVKDKLEEIFKAKNNILTKLENQEILTNSIGSIANRMIDQNKFAAAQEIIKLAKTVPEKMVTAYKRSQEESKARNFRSAERSLSNCYDLAIKIEDFSLQTYLALKRETTREIPNYEKELRSLYTHFSKELIKEPTFLSYERQISRTSRSIELLDELENDQQIEIVTELSNDLVLANKLTKNLRELDRQIKKLIDKLSIETISPESPPTP